MPGKQSKNARKTDLAHSEDEIAESKQEILLRGNLKNDVLARNQIIHMPFLEDVLNEDEEMLKRINK